jgi:hypothetical protein
MRANAPYFILTYDVRRSVGYFWKKSSSVPSSIQWLTRHKGDLSHTPRKGTILGCRRYRQVTTSFLND